jgi:hypothetical protein
MTQRSKALVAAGLPSTLVTKLAGPAAAANVEIVGTISDPQMKLLIKQTFAWSIRNMWIFYTCVGAIGVIASFFIRKAALSEEHTETKTGLVRSESRDNGIGLQER